MTTIYELLEANEFLEYADSLAVKGCRNFQRRVDELYPEAPLCQTNDKLFIDVAVYDDNSVMMCEPACEISLVHGAKDYIWFDIKAYSITVKTVMEPGKLTSIMNRLVAAWTAVNMIDDNESCNIDCMGNTLSVGDYVLTPELPSCKLALAKIVSSPKNSICSDTVFVNNAKADPSKLRQRHHNAMYKLPGSEAMEQILKHTVPK